MNWEKEAINELRIYKHRKDSLESTKERIRSLREKLQGIRSSSCDSTPVQGGGNRMEDNLINNLVEQQRLKYNYSSTIRLVRLTKKGLDSLDERERLVLEKFYIERAPRYIEWLMSELHVEQSRVYQIKDDALYHFTIGMYGIIDY